MDHDPTSLSSVDIAREFIRRIYNSLRTRWFGKVVPGIWASVCLCLLNTFIFAEVTGSTATGESSAFRADRVLVRFKPHVTEEECSEFYARLQLLVHRRFTIIENCEVLVLPTGVIVEELIRQCETSELVDMAEPDYWVHASAAPNDPGYLNGTLWGLNNSGRNGGRRDADIDAPEAWDVLNDAGDIIVAVIDSGIRYTHQDLAANIWSNPGETGFDVFGRNKATNRIDDDGNGFIDDVHGIDTVLDTGDPIDPNGHGTHVAGIIGAVGNNRVGIAGVAWRVKLMACRFLDNSRSGSISDAIQCIQYARNHGATIINASWGNTNPSLFLESAIRQCQDSGIILVAAAGNEGINNDEIPSYPANYDLDNVLSVTATTRTDSLASGSNIGATSVDLAAPGSSIYSTFNRSNVSYAFLSGTSMSAPHVSGALALVRTLFSGEVYQHNINRLIATTDPIPNLEGKTVSGGRLNLDKALRTKVEAKFLADAVTGSPPLAVRFSNLSFGNGIQFEWNFGDDSAASLEPSPMHLFDKEGDFAVRLTVTDMAGNQSRSSRVISVVANYNMRSAEFDWINPSSMSSITLSDDEVSAAQRLPFEFRFYGEEFNELFVGSNGLIGFVNQGLDTSVNSDLPDSMFPNGIICPWWDDLDPSSGGEIRIGTIGVAPNRRQVVSWVNVPHRASRSSSFTFQAVLHEASNQILFQYLKVDPNRSRGAGKTAAIGIENGTGLVARKYSYGGITPLKDRQAILFTPSDAGGLRVATGTDFTSSGEVGGPFTPSSQAYILENTSMSDLVWAVGKTQDWISISPNNGILATGHSTMVTVAINSAAQSLRTGNYKESISFDNLDTGNGSTSRSVNLVVRGGGGIIDVTPDLGFYSSGFVGGLFNPQTQSYRLRNTGDAVLEWIAEGDVDWISINPSEGLLNPGNAINLSVSVAEGAEQLADGTYTGRVVFKSQRDGNRRTDREIVLTVISPKARLATGAKSEIQFTGSASDQIESFQSEVILTNLSDDSLEWRGASTEIWVDLSPERGRLNAGESASVIVSINENGDLLAPGLHRSEIVFTSTGGVARASTIVLFELVQQIRLRAEIHDLESGIVRVQLTGESDSSYQIEGSLNLLDWNPLRTVRIPLSGRVEFFDPEANRLSPRFYRAVLLE